MIKSRIAVAGALLAAAGAANAGITVTPTLTSDYDFRGLTQTLNDPAFQLGLTYEGDGGFYMGMWGSNVDFASGDAGSNSGTNSPGSGIGDYDRPSTEIDVFLGYAWGDAENGFGFDAGGIYYSYPNAGEGNFAEFYAGIAKGPFSAKAWYSWDFANSGWGAYYLEANLAAPLADGFSLLGHLGYSDGDYWDGQYRPGRSHYMDWSVGIGYDVKGTNLSVKYVDGSDHFSRTPRNLGRFIFSISTTLGD